MLRQLARPMTMNSTMRTGRSISRIGSTAAMTLDTAATMAATTALTVVATLMRTPMSVTTLAAALAR